MFLRKSLLSLLRIAGLVPEGSKTEAARHYFLAPIWETLVFQYLPVSIIVAPVIQSWNIPWVAEPTIDRSLKVLIIVLEFLATNCAFVTYHRPGHFVTWWKELRASRIMKAMEGAWVWKDYSKARDCAIALLRLAEDLWILEGSQFARCQQGLALYVLCMTGEGFGSKEGTRMANIFRESGICKSDIMSHDEIVRLLKDCSVADTSD